MKERFVQDKPPGPWEPAILFAAFGALYLATASPFFLGSDSGLFAVIFADGGYAHPPGYPLYSLYLRAMSWLPAQSAAHGASLATALIGAGAVAVLYDAARRWGLSRLASLFGALCFGLASHVWVYHTQPEVFALNHLLAAGIFWFAAPRSPATGLGRVAALGFLAGLGLAHHHPIVLIAPVGLWGVYTGLRESDSNPLLTLGAGIAALAAGLTPYAYLLAVEHWDLGWHWRSPNSLDDLLTLFLRLDYGTFQLKPGESGPDRLGQIAFWARSVSLDLYVVPIASAAVGAIAGCAGWFSRRARLGPTAPFCFCLVASLLLAGPFFASLLPREPEGVSYIFLRRFHLFSELHLALLAAMGADVAARRWIRPRVAALAAGAVAVAGLLLGYGEVRVRHDPAVEHYIEDTFTSLPDDAVVVGTGDHHFFGLLYLQRARNERTDIDYVDMALFDAFWYRERVARNLVIESPISPDAYGSESLDADSFDIDRFFAELQSTGRPLFATGAFREGVFDDWTIAPYGTLMRIFPEGVSQPPVDSIFRTNQQLFSEFRIQGGRTPPKTTWARHILEDYAGSWTTTARGLESVGRDDLAEEARSIAAFYAPWKAEDK